MTTEDWRDWRLEHAGLGWSVALPEDEPAIAALLDRTEQHLGWNQERPDLFAPPVILTLVAKTPAGKVVDAVAIELVADIRKLGLNRAAMSAYPKLLPVIGGFLQERGVRLAHMSCIERWAKVMEKPLKALGFMPTGKSHWVRRVRP